MRRHLDSARRDTHRRSPFAISSRLTLLLASIGLSTVISSSLEAQEPLLETAFQYQPPSAPGQPFSFRFERVPGYQSGLLITNRSTTTNAGATSENATDDLDLQPSVLIPLSTQTDGTGLIGLDGIVPNTVTEEELKSSIVEVRLVLFDPLTLECLISDPLALAAPPDPDDFTTVPEPPVAPDQGPLQTQDLTSGTVPTDTTGDDTKAYASTVDDPQVPACPFASSTGIAVNQLGTGSFGITALRPIVGSFIITNIHDQPTPVQGSGH